MMLDLHSAFNDFMPEIELAEPSVDRDFITNFLLPYFRHLPRETLEAELAAIISREQDLVAKELR